MSVTQKQKDCRNIWHRNPGALLKCPHCDMTLGELANNPPPDQPNRMAAVPSRGAPPDVRVEFKLFRAQLAQVDAMIREVNDYCKKIAADRRTEVVNSEFKITDTEAYLIVAQRVIIG